MKRNALTLIEVVASLVLLAVAASALLTAQSRSIAKLQELRENSTAARLASGLIADWKLQPRGTRIPDEGSFDDSPGWRWRRTVRTIASRAVALQEISLMLIHDARGDDQVAGTWVWLERIDAPRK